MSAEELREAANRRIFEPFRLVMTDGAGYEIRYPELIMVGRRSATVGLATDPSQPYYDRTVKIDLLHVIRLEPLETRPPSGQNGPAAPPSSGASS
jgi:hypothetical protein